MFPGNATSSVIPCTNNTDTAAQIVIESGLTRKRRTRSSSSPIETLDVESQIESATSDSESSQDSGCEGASRPRRRRRRKAVAGGPRDAQPEQRKKAGRKFTTEEPRNKRIAQNRIAQRLHRERKTQYVKDLEAKVENLTKTVETLESTRGSNGTSKTSRETKLLDALKQKISELEAENSSLRQVAFGFDLQQTTGVWVNDGSSTSSPSIVPLASPAQQQAFLLGGMPSPSSPLNSSPLNGVPHHVASFGFTF